MYALGPKCTLQLPIDHLRATSVPSKYSGHITVQYVCLQKIIACWKWLQSTMSLATTKTYSMCCGAIKAKLHVWLLPPCQDATVHLTHWRFSVVIHMLALLDGGTATVKNAVSHLPINLAALMKARQTLGALCLRANTVRHKGGVWGVGIHSPSRSRLGTGGNNLSRGPSTWNKGTSVWLIMLCLYTIILI